jgi:replicative DNA helicase
MPIEINDARDGKGVLEIRSQAREWMRGKECGLIFIDHFQCIDPPPRVENPVQAATRNAKGLKSMARELNVPVIALSQVSRKVSEREDHRPRLSDIRDSQMIVAESDVILGLYRKGYYEVREATDEDASTVAESWPAEAEILGLKHRGGQEFSRKVWFDGPTGRFYEEHPGLGDADAPPDYGGRYGN